MASLMLCRLQTRMTTYSRRLRLVCSPSKIHIPRGDMALGALASPYCENLALSRFMIWDRFPFTWTMALISVIFASDDDTACMHASIRSLFMQCQCARGRGQHPAGRSMQFLSTYSVLAHYLSAPGFALQMVQKVRMVSVSGFRRGCNLSIKYLESSLILDP